MTPLTMPSSELGIDTSAAGERTVKPSTLYIPKLAPNAVSAEGTVAQAET